MVGRPIDDGEIEELDDDRGPNQGSVAIYSEDAEQAVLSAMLMDPDAIAFARGVLDSTDFYRDGHGRIFRAMLALFESGDVVDPLTLSEELTRSGSLETIGGKDYIGFLVDAVPTAANVEYHTKIVLEKAKRRALVDRLERDVRQLRKGKEKAPDIAARLLTALEHLRLADSAAPRPFPVVRVLEGVPITPPAVQVANLILDRDLNLWTGHGGAGKTVLLYLTAIGVVLGTPIFGALAVHRSGPVLLVIPEDGQAAARMILDAIVEGLALDTTQTQVLAEQLVMISDDVEVKITADTSRLGATAREHGAVMVILDPLSNLLGGASERDEDIATVVSAALRRDVCRGAGATVLLSHHFRKPGKELGGGETIVTVHDARGSGAWMNSARLGFGVAKKGQRITMTCLKSNRLRSDIRHELDLEIVGDPANKAHWLSCRVTDANVGASSEALTPGIGRELNANERAALGCLDDQHEPDKRLSWSTWRDDSGLNPNTFKSVKDRLLDAGLAAAIPTGRKTRSGGPEYGYQLTANGRHALNTGWVAERSRGEGVRSGV